MQAIAVRVLEKTLGTLHPTVCVALSHLGQLYDMTEEREEGERLSREAVRRSTESLGEENITTADLKDALAASVQGQVPGQCDLQQAERLWKECVETYEIGYGEDHPDTLILNAKIARNYQVQGRSKEGEALIRRCIELGPPRLTRSSPGYMGFQDILASCLEDQDRLEEAIEIREGNYQGLKDVSMPLPEKAQYGYITFIGEWAILKRGRGPMMTGSRSMQDIRQEFNAS